MHLRIIKSFERRHDLKSERRHDFKVKFYVFNYNN